MYVRIADSRRCHFFDVNTVHAVPLTLKKILGISRKRDRIEERIIDGVPWKFLRIHDISRNINEWYFSILFLILVGAPVVH